MATETDRPIFSGYSGGEESGLELGAGGYFQIMVENAPLAMAMLDEELRYMVANQRWLQEFHLEGQEIVGMTQEEVFPELNDGWREIYRRCLGGGIERCEEDLYIRPDGTRDWVRWEVRPWRRPDMSVGGLLLNSEIVTPLKEREKNLEFESLFTRSLMGSETPLVVVDRNGEVQRLSAGAVSRLAAEEAGSANGRKFLDIFPPLGGGLPDHEEFTGRIFAELPDAGRGPLATAVRAGGDSGPLAALHWQVVPQEGAAEVLLLGHPVSLDADDEGGDSAKALAAAGMGALGGALVGNLPGGAPADESEELKELRAERDALVKEIKPSREEVDRLRRQIETLEEERGEYRERIDSLVEDQEKQAGELEEFTTRQEKSEEEAEALRKEIETLEEQVSRSEEDDPELAALQVRVEDLDGERGSLLAQIAELTTARSNENEETGKELEELRKEVERLRADRDAAAEEATNADEELREVLAVAEARARSLEEEANRHRAIPENVPFGLALVGSDGRVVYRNESFPRLLGYDCPADCSIEDYLRRGCPDDSYAEQLLDDWREKVWQKGLARVFSLASADGLIKEIELRPTHLPDGEMVLAGFDVTERIRGEEALRGSEARFRSLFRDSGFPIALVDPAGDIFDINGRVERLLGFGRLEMRRRGIETLVVDEDQGKRRAALEANGESSDPVTVEVCLRHREGEAIPVRMMIKPIHDNEGRELYASYYLLPGGEDGEAKDQGKAAESEPSRETGNAGADADGDSEMTADTGDDEDKASLESVAPVEEPGRPASEHRLAGLIGGWLGGLPDLLLAVDPTGEVLESHSPEGFPVEIPRGRKPRRWNTFCRGPKGFSMNWGTRRGIPSSAWSSTGMTARTFHWSAGPAGDRTVG